MNFEASVRSEKTVTNKCANEMDTKSASTSTLESIDNLLVSQYSLTYTPSVVGQYLNRLGSCDLNNNKDLLVNVLTTHNNGENVSFSKRANLELSESVTNDYMKENRRECPSSMYSVAVAGSDVSMDFTSMKRLLLNHDYPNSKVPRKISMEAQRLLNKAKGYKKKIRANYQLENRQIRHSQSHDDDLHPDSDTSCSVQSTDCKSSSNSSVKVTFINSMEPVSALNARKHTEDNELKECNDDGGNVSTCLEDDVTTETEQNSVSYLIPSLFHFVPPVLKFFKGDENIEKPCSSIRKLMLWEKSRAIPEIVKDVLKRVGFRFTSKAKVSVGRWGNHIKCKDFCMIGPFQKVNHYPGTFHLGRKDTIWKDLKYMQRKFGHADFDFMPCTYILPQDAVALQKHLASGKGEPMRFIIKPPAGSRGTGIRLVESIKDIPENSPFIAQKYLDNPCLINGHKFDIRLYVYVPGVDPLRIFLFDDGLVRFASRKYSSSVEFLEDQFVHLTNYSVNKLNSEYSPNHAHGSCEGHKWSLKSLWKYFETNNIDHTAIWTKIKDIVIKTILSSVHHIRNLTHYLTRGPHNVHELFGFDIILDANYRPWLLEVNISPSLNTNSALDVAVKEGMLIDMLNMAGFVVPDFGFNKLSHLIENRMSNHWLLPFVTPAITDEEREKFSHSSLEDCDKILDSLTPNEVRTLMRVEDELSRCGRFTRIFPTRFGKKYLSYMIRLSHYDLLLHAWTNKYSERRKEGINLLIEYSRIRRHLKDLFPLTNGVSFPQPQVSVRQSKSNSIND